MSSLHIAFISPFQKRLQRGIERSTRNLALNLAEQGVSVAILCRSGSLPEDQTLIQTSVQYFTAPGTRYFEALSSVPAYILALLRFKPDIVIVYFAGYGEAAALSMFRLFFPVKTVFTVGYPIESVPHRFEQFKQSGLNKHLDAIIVKARYMAPAIEDFFNYPTHYIPNGVDTAFFQPAAKKSESSAFQLVTVAALEKRKGFDTVLATLPQVVDQVGPVRYTIIGEGPDRDWLANQIQFHDVQQYVNLVGQVEDVRPYLREADIFLLPSEGEGLPNAYLEALAMGLPTIVSDVPPYDDIAHPDFAIRVEHGNVSAMQDAIVALLRDSEKRGMMGKAARQHAEATYSWQHVARQYIEIFEGL